jgi:hypothetical protein
MAKKSVLSIAVKEYHLSQSSQWDSILNANDREEDQPVSKEQQEAIDIYYHSHPSNRR